ncbi:pantothenate synthase [Serendipita sp. 396]|nr:pantothenate synthase [Serendipita sp. 396]KAG8781244.1 pantothenate synthase [Serendipita sp. 397]
MSSTSAQISSRISSPVVKADSGIDDLQARIKEIAGPIQILDSLNALREWRHNARAQATDVGFVPTMGALHEGHLDLVRVSIAHNPLTVVSIFVNPAQFAPHEDLATYPRTLERDLEALKRVVTETSSNDEASSTSAARSKGALVVFVPSVRDMYPSGITQEVELQKGTFIQVKGYEHEMEGKSRPGFFRGVATVVTKLFNAVEPTHAYFGQKDIQQALLLRRLVSDVLLSHPLPENLHIVPTHRDASTGLALSSRNAYLTDRERVWAPTLYKALKAGQAEWEASITGASGKDVDVKTVKKAAEEVIERVIKETSQGEGAESVRIKSDYISLNWADSFEPLETIEGQEASRKRLEERGVVISGAMWVGKTRLIDNLVLAGSGWIIR